MMSSIALDGYLNLVPVMLRLYLLWAQLPCCGFVMTLKSIEPKASKLNPIKVWREYLVSALSLSLPGAVEVFISAAFAGTLYFNFEEIVSIET